MRKPQLHSSSSVIASLFIEHNRDEKALIAMKFYVFYVRLCVAGPLLASPVVDVAVTVTEIQKERGTSVEFVSAAASHIVSQALSKANVNLMEPIMRLEVRQTRSYQVLHVSYVFTSKLKRSSSCYFPRSKMTPLVCKRLYSCVSKIRVFKMIKQKKIH